MSALKEKIQKNCSDILRYIRIAKGFDQKKMATLLEVSITKYSRLENGKANLHLHQLAILNYHFGITQNDIISGYISNNNTFDFSSFQIPKHLNENSFSNGPILNLFVNYFKETLGEKYFNEFSKKEGVNPLCFLNSKISLNLNYNLRILQQLVIKDKLKSQKDLDTLADYAIGLKTHHGKFYDKYNKEKGLNRVKSFLNNATYYEENHDYQVEDISNWTNTIIFSYRPKDHVDLNIYKNDFILGDLATKWISTYINKFAMCNTSTKRLMNFHKGDDRCLYRLKVL